MQDKGNSMDVLLTFSLSSGVKRKPKLTKQVV